jgi:folate-binding protein YgfZ
MTSDRTRTDPTREVSGIMNDPASVYRALSRSVVLFDRSGRDRIEVTGPDRAKFLHNLTTNDVKRLAVGHGHESFVTSLQGRTLGYVTLLAGEDRILVRSEPGAFATLMPHLRKYGAFDDIAIDDATARTFELHLAGPLADELVRRLGATLPAPRELDHEATRLGDVAVRVVREAPTGRPGLSLIGAAADAPTVLERLHAEGASHGLADGDPATFEAARIEAGTPCFGRDVTADNLPQELGRDARAINFVKGCYLGQETVARIDALGHVNKDLRGLKLPPGPVPPAGTPIVVDGKTVGTVTSSADSQGWSHPVALAYLRSAFAKAGTEVTLPLADSGTTLTAVVADLPMLPPSA